MVCSCDSSGRGLHGPARLVPAGTAALILAAQLLAGGCAGTPGGIPARSPDTPPAVTEASRERVFVAWHAPHGSPGAADTLRTGCDDPDRVDTLIVSVFTPRDLPNVIAMSASLRFEAASPDSLGPFWQFKSGTANERSMFIEFDAGSGSGCPQPWRGAGSGAVRYDLRGSDSELHLEYAIPSEQSIPIMPEVENCVARIRILEKRHQLGGCGQPVRVTVDMVRFELLDGGTLELDAAASNTVYWNPEAEGEPERAD